MARYRLLSCKKRPGQCSTMSQAIYYHSPVLPWYVSYEERRRFRNILLSSLLGCLFFSILIPLLPERDIENARQDNDSQRLARLLIDPAQLELPEPKQAPIIIESPPTIEPLKKDEHVKPITEKINKDAARKKAAGSGLLALSNDLLEIRKKDVTSKVTHVVLNKPSQKRELNAAIKNIDAQTGHQSTGVKDLVLGNDIAIESLGEHESTQVESQTLSAIEEEVKQRDVERSFEEIQIVIDLHKGKLNALYNRALRKDPMLEGAVVFELVISSSGKVVSCRVVSSELNSPDLERKLISRIKLFDFGEKHTPQTTVNIPIKFLPG